MKRISSVLIGLAFVASLSPAAFSAVPATSSKNAVKIHAKLHEGANIVKAANASYTVIVRHGKIVAVRPRSGVHHLTASGSLALSAPIKNGDVCAECYVDDDTGETICIYYDC